mmetsp:Transcript_28351/g.67111  ORF Transcript_28351/g.67111 Transcript_28351/m.67111 type:complete len:203 (-) Transcript_28351:253-861(-)
MPAVALLAVTLFNPLSCAGEAGVPAGTDAGTAPGGSNHFGAARRLWFVAARLVAATPRPSSPCLGDIHSGRPMEYVYWNCGGGPRASSPCARSHSTSSGPGLANTVKSWLSKRSTRRAAMTPHDAHSQRVRCAGRLSSSSLASTLFDAADKKFCNIARRTLFCMRFCLRFCSVLAKGLTRKTTTTAGRTRKVRMIKKMRRVM